MPYKPVTNDVTWTECGSFVTTLYHEKVHAIS